MPPDPKRPRLREALEIRKLEAETAEIEARTLQTRLRTVLVTIAVALVLVHVMIGWAIVPEHADMVARLLP